MADDAIPKNAALRKRATDLLSTLRVAPTGAAVDEGRKLVNDLKGEREFEAVMDVAEAVLRQAPKDARTKRLYAQALIETGRATVAIDVLRTITNDAAESDEAFGLMGRAHKQIFFDSGDKSSAAAREAVKKAVSAYRVPFDKTGNPWHGINLAAVLTTARRRFNLRVAPDLEPAAIAKAVIATLDNTPAEKRDYWYHASVAEAYLALGDWPQVEDNLRRYLTDPSINAFALGSTLRQFTEVWGLESDAARGRPLVDILRARTLELPGGGLQLAPADLRRLASSEPPVGQPEAILGTAGTRTYKWLMLGLSRAGSVGSISDRTKGDRIGTCFVVAAKTVGIDSDERLVLTNYHVVNAAGEAPGIQPQYADVRFEAIEGSTPIPVAQIVWGSPRDQLDATVLRLAAPIPDAVPSVGASDVLPVVGQPPQRVFVIGHPAGKALAFSLEDNELLDHEGPPKGAPPKPDVVRIHYKAPTEPGNSGSPVFNDKWDVIGLHHLGGKLGMPRLNGQTGTYAANEGIWIQSIAKAPKP